MSGHSKWATTKHKKAAIDAKRGKLFAKLIKNIEVAARTGGGDVAGNPTLYDAVQKAKKTSVPNDNIDRAIKRGSGAEAGASDWQTITYEGYAPGGVALGSHQPGHVVEGQHQAAFGLAGAHAQAAAVAAANHIDLFLGFAAAARGRQFGEFGDHLRQLAAAGLVTTRREGYYVLYSVVRERIGPLSEGVLAFLGDSSARTEQA